MGIVRSERIREIKACYDGSPTQDAKHIFELAGYIDTLFESLDKQCELTESYVKANSELQARIDRLSSGQLTKAQVGVLKELWELAKDSLEHSHPDINAVGEEIDAFESQVMRVFPKDWVKIIGV